MYEPALLRLEPTLPSPGGLTILDQGQEGACTGFGLAAIINLLNRQRNRRIRVSPRMLYEMARRFDEWPGEDYSGSSCRGAIRGWHNMGVCSERAWPYEVDDAAVLTITRAEEARSNTIGAYYRLRHVVSDVHAALNEVGVIYVSANVHEGWQGSGPRSGVIPFQPGTIGGHAFAVVGYDERGFIVQNSWGPRWGKRGLALWTYEDWHANVRDAWVVRLAIPTPQIFGTAPSRHVPASDSRSQAQGPTRREIAGHFVHYDDGQFDDNGKYWSNLSDVQVTADNLEPSQKYPHLLFYAHGGLNDTKSSARRISAMRDVFKANGIYPYHFMYDTGLLEEIKDVLLGRHDETVGRVGNIFTDASDRAIEYVARKPGRAFWREMKRDARTPFEEQEAGQLTLNAIQALASVEVDPHRRPQYGCSAAGSRARRLRSPGSAKPRRQLQSDGAGVQRAVLPDSLRTSPPCGYERIRRGPYAHIQLDRRAGAEGYGRALQEVVALPGIEGL